MRTTICRLISGLFFTFLAVMAIGCQGTGNPYDLQVDVVFTDSDTFDSANPGLGTPTHAGNNPAVPSQPTKKFPEPQVIPLCGAGDIPLPPVFFHEIRCFLR